MSSNLASAVDDLERKLKRLIRDVQGGSKSDPTAIVNELRKIIRNEVDAIDQIARRQ